MILCFLSGDVGLVFLCASIPVEEDDNKTTAENHVRSLKCDTSGQKSCCYVEYG